MLDQLLNKSRCQDIKSTKNWEEAITIAAQPLLDQDCINAEYIEKMINAVKQFGPYIVLADRFALPHASNTGEVNELSMSLLRLEEDVDVLGQPVSTFLVLATIDANSHMEALSELAELLFDENNLMTFTTKSTDEILSVIHSEVYRKKGG